MSQPETVERMTTRQAAAYLQVSRDTVHRLIQSGQLRARKKTLALTSAYMVERDSVLEFERRRHEQTGAGQ